MDFNHIIGHKRQIEAIKNSIENDRISHCYLFEGEEGLGKKEFALAFSKTLLCKEGKSEACNSCSSCIKFGGGNHPDFKLLAPLDRIIKKGEIDKLIGSMSTLPFESKRKIFIIEDCQMMNAEGQNALLKTLEEPPEYVNLILISPNSSKILPTILSRCQIIKFHSLSQDLIVDRLARDYKMDEKEARFIANFSQGSLKKSIELVEDENFPGLRTELIKILDALIKGDRLKAFSSMDFFNEHRDRIDLLLDMIEIWFRDLLIYNLMGDSPLIINGDKIEILSKQSLLDLSRINDIIYRVEETKVNINRNINFALSMETMLLNI